MIDDFIWTNLNLCGIKCQVGLMQWTELLQMGDKNWDVSVCGMYVWMYLGMCVYMKREHMRRQFDASACLGSPTEKKN